MYEGNPELLLAPYAVRSDVSLESFLLFAKRLEGERIAITAANHRDLSALAAELQFGHLLAELAAFSADSPSRVDILEEGMHEQALQIAALQGELARLHELLAPIPRLEAEIAELRGRLPAPTILENGDRIDRIEATVACLEEETLDQFRVLDGRINGVKRLEVDIERLNTASSLVQRRLNIAICAYVPGNELDGIIAQITLICGGDIHVGDLLTISHSSCAGPSLGSSNLVDLRNPSVFCSADSPNQWVRYHFAGNMIRPTGYVIRSSVDECEAAQSPQSWVVHGSRGNGWSVLDERLGENGMNAANACRYFAIHEAEEVTDIQFSQIGRNHVGTHTLCLSAFEIFGYIADYQTL
jgi:hypothetical protein